MFMYINFNLQSRKKRPTTKHNKTPKLSIRSNRFLMLFASWARSVFANLRSIEKNPEKTNNKKKNYTFFRLKQRHWTTLLHRSFFIRRSTVTQVPYLIYSQTARTVHKAKMIVLYTTESVAEHKRNNI